MVLSFSIATIDNWRSMRVNNETIIREKYEQKKKY